MRLHDRFEIIRTYEQMCEAGKIATAYFHEVCLKDPTIISGCTFRVRDIRECNEDIEKTYLVRLFALFEVTLRDFWGKCLNRRTKPVVEVLIDRIASHRYVQDAVRNNVHAVRNYRNSLIHAGVAIPVELKEARSYLCKFLANLPEEW